MRARLAAALLLACGHASASDETSRPVVPTVDSTLSDADRAVAEAIAHTLAGHLDAADLGTLHGVPVRPLWSRDGRPGPASAQAIALLAAAADHGLDPAAYDAASLALAGAGLAEAGSPSPEGVARFEVALGSAVLRFLDAVHRGRVDARTVGFDYHAGDRHRSADLLARALAAGDLASAVAEAEPTFAQYGRLRHALARYRGLAARASLPTLPAARRVAPGDVYPGLSRLTARLHALGDLAAGEAPEESGRYDGAAVEAVKRFQTRHGLAVDGVLGPSTLHQLDIPLARRVRQIELALERLRWLPHAPAGPVLVANVPAFRLVALDPAASERPALQMRIVVGRAARTRTPLFAGAVRHVIFRPFWYPPRSIVVKEMLPAIRRDPGYLARERLELVARSEDRAPAQPPTAANLRRLARGSLRLRQQPGPRNALGLVKFQFPNPYDVYLHDTPAKGLFARARRDFSHGCIRVENAPALAGFLLAGRPEWTADRIAAEMHGDRTVRVDLPAAVPIVIYYTTAIVQQDGTISFYEDIYGLDASLVRALPAAALSPPRGSPAP